MDIGKEDEGKFSVEFAVTLDINIDTDLVKETTHTWDTLKTEKLYPQVCFSTKEEFLECQEEFGKLSNYHQFEIKVLDSFPNLLSIKALLVKTVFIKAVLIKSSVD